ncbi:hypothetical protein [Winogradskyella sp.]|uniref:hypothetical protein n=1 Tax=Winogradskyella sp. TaxID=1883156 RepID=UPI0026058D6E|nr:hypothetical protein [Winogradskyella sp.]
MTASSLGTSVRNNLKLLSYRKKAKDRLGLKNRLGTNSSGAKTEYNLPKPTTKELNAIAKRLKKEHKTRMGKVIVVTILLFLGLVYAFVYSSNGIIELLTY